MKDNIKSAIIGFWRMGAEEIIGNTGLGYLYIERIIMAYYKKLNNEVG